MVRLDGQSLGNQVDVDAGIARKNLMELGRHAAHVIDDDDRHPQVGRQILRKPDLGVEAARRTADADDRETFHRPVGLRHLPGGSGHFLVH